MRQLEKGAKKNAQLGKSKKELYEKKGEETNIAREQKEKPVEKCNRFLSSQREFRQHGNHSETTLGPLLCVPGFRQVCP